MTYQYCYFQFDGELEAVRSAIEDAISLQLSERDSCYWGGKYFLLKDDTTDSRLQLHRNIDHRGEWINNEFKGSYVLCYLSGPVDRVNAFLAEMIGAGGLPHATRTKEVDDK